MPAIACRRSAFRVDFEPGPMGLELQCDTQRGLVTVKGAYTLHLS
jgi:hypothetical protein